MGMGRGMGMGGMGMGGGMGGMGMRRDGPTIHSLLADHEKVKRTVEEIPDGIRSVTTSDEPEVAALIRKHVWQMKDRLERGEPIRMMDPLFREVFAHHDKIRMAIEDVPGGVRVTETSDDPQVVLLIRQHARTVNEFVESGMRRMHQPTPLPEGYAR
jgi:hypothetical protein